MIATDIYSLYIAFTSDKENDDENQIKENFEQSNNGPQKIYN